MARLKQRYLKEIRPALMQEFGYSNPMEAPRLDKVVVNMGLGEAISNGKILDASVEQLSAITGQKPVVTRARKSIANFKLRQGQSIGAMVTLRGERAYEFFDRLVNIALPRVRDFKGVSPKAFDGKGNYTLGVKEQIIFPEINYDKVEKIKGLNITVVTTARSDEEGRALLRELFTTPADLLPDEGAGVLRVRLHTLANPRSNHAVAALCEALTATETCFPGTTLRLVYEPPVLQT